MTLDDLTQEQQARISEIKVALEGEFRENLDGPGNARKSALQDIEDLKPDFLAALQHITRHADSATLRAKVAMWGYDKLIEQGKASTDPLIEMMHEMEAARTTNRKVPAISSNVQLFETPPDPSPAESDDPSPSPSPDADYS